MDQLYLDCHEGRLKIGRCLWDFSSSFADRSRNEVWGLQGNREGGEEGTFQVEHDLIFLASPAACSSSQARNRTRATAGTTNHSSDSAESLAPRPPGSSQVEHNLDASSITAESTAVSPPSGL